MGRPVSEGRYVISCFLILRHVPGCPPDRHSLSSPGRGKYGKGFVWNRKNSLAASLRVSLRKRKWPCGPLFQVVDRRMAPPGRWLAPITWTLPNQMLADACAYLWDGFLGQIVETTNWPV